MDPVGKRRRRDLRVIAVVATCACLLAGVVGLAALPAGASNSWIVRASATTITVGGWKIYGSRTLPTYGGAIRAFGTPQTCVLKAFVPGQKPASNYSHVRWISAGAAADFITYGVIRNGGDACSEPSSVQLDKLTLTGQRWLTDRGLRVGDSVSRLQRLYPVALPHNNAFWIVTRRNRVGSDSIVPVFSATVAQGRVTSLSFAIGAQGD